MEQLKISMAILKFCREKLGSLFSKLQVFRFSDAGFGGELVHFDFGTRPPSGSFLAIKTPVLIRVLFASVKRICVLSNRVRDPEHWTLPYLFIGFDNVADVVCAEVVEAVNVLFHQALHLQEGRH
jgi:hypothetical protein